MNLPIRQLEQSPAPSEDALPTELLRLIQALARAHVEEDYAAALAAAQD